VVMGAAKAVGLRFILRGHGLLPGIAASFRMGHVHNFVFSLFLLVASVGWGAAQMTTHLTGPPDPFRIAAGSTFTASGGGRNGSSAVKHIASDIREAEALILGNHVDSPGIDAGSITKIALGEMLHSLDPHSNYHDAAEWKELLNEQHSGYTGIGATIANFSDGTNRGTYVLSVAAGSAAAAAKVRFGDRLIAVNGVDTRELDVTAVRNLLRGDAGTKLSVAVERSATGKTETLDLQRKVISQPSIPDAYMLRPGVGYIDLTEGFDYTTADEFDRALQGLKKNGLRSLVLDLRWNGGGILDQAVKIAEKFLPAGTQILSQRGRFPANTRTYISENTAPETMPLVVLINSRTASASEILAGALQDNDRALIVGERSYGKGLVQTVIDLPDGSGLTLTTGRYLTPSGRSIQRDYSNTDLYDYYNHTTPSSGVGNAYFEARTTTNRKVYGGDGIQPDEEVKTGEITHVQAELLDATFYFMRDVIRRASDAKKGTDPGNRFLDKMSKDDIMAGREELIASFSEFMKDGSHNGIKQKALVTELPFIRTRLHYYLSMASHGPVSANRILTASDPQVERGAEAISRAALLAELAAKAGQIRK
jgi:carboxyl-terminal processing protease